MDINSTSPPRFSFWVIQFFCKERYHEEILGDLEEYYVRVLKKNTRFGIFKYWYHTFNFLRFYALKIPFENSIIGTMLKLNLLVAYRNLLRHKFYTFINLFGLALSLTTCLLITVFVKDEMSYDKHWQDAERIYRVTADLKFANDEFKMAVSPAPMADGFREEFPELVAIGRMQNNINVMAQVGEFYFKQDQISFTDPEILDILKFNFIEGSEEGLLASPTSAAISREASLQMYNTVNSLGETFEVGGIKYEVKAVYDDIPKNTHFHYSMLLPMHGNQGAKSPVWLSNNFKTYLKLDATNNPQALEEKFPLTLKKYFGPQLEQFAGTSYDQIMESGGRIKYDLQPIESIHLHSDLQYEIEANGDIQYVYIFITAGLFILIIAVINFMNISTARSSLRAKEVGLRKVIGSKRGLLIGQFMTESMLNTFLAAFLAILMLYITLPLFNSFTGKLISNPLFGEMMLWDEVFISSLIIGFLSGVYPAFYLSGFEPIDVLKGRLGLGMNAGALRNVLVVAQFGASVILIFGSVVIFSQLRYTMQKSLGFNKDETLVVSETFNLGSSAESFKQELAKYPAIKSASLSGYLPISGNRSDSPLIPKGTDEIESAVSFQNWLVDDEYIPTYQMKLKAGRNFNPDLLSDSASIIINEVAVQRLGFEEPIGQKIKAVKDFRLYGRNEFTIIGVVENFHFDNFKNEISPLSLVRGNSNGALTIRFEAARAEEVLNLVEETWKKFNSNIPFNYVFPDQQFEQMYEAERKIGTLFNVFAILAILIACLGLFGLAAFTADQRKKELGIRKVLGASTPTLMMLQLRGYTILLAVAIVMSLPLGWYLTKQWLEGFAYRTSYDIVMFVVPALAVLVLAWSTVSFISYAASKRNPVDNLKYE